MTQMFDSFINQPPNYVPNNMFKFPPAMWVDLDADTVHKVYKHGKLTGFWWNWGDDVSITVKNQIVVYIPETSIVTYEAGEYPTEQTYGYFVGQKFYNLTDLKSFTLTGIIYVQETQSFVWEEDRKFTYLDCGERPTIVQMPTEEGEQFVVQLFNFRMEKVKEEIFPSAPFTWHLTPDESLKIQQGTYTLNIHQEVRQDDISTKLRLSNSYEIVVLFDGENSNYPDKHCIL